MNTTFTRFFWRHFLVQLVSSHKCYNLRPHNLVLWLFQILCFIHPRRDKWNFDCLSCAQSRSPYMPAHVFHGMCQSLTDNGAGERCVDGLGIGPLPHRVYKRSIHAATEHMLPIACGPHTLQLSICFLLHVDPEWHTFINWDGILIRADWLHLIYPWLL